MAMQVTMGAQLKCSFGAATSALVVMPKNRVTTNNMPDANIMDNVAMANILPFGNCICMANPQVIAATAQAYGVPTPAPCVPNIPAPWIPGSATVMIGKMPALNNSSKLMCMWGGIIEITDPGQTTVSIA